MSTQTITIYSFHEPDSCGGFIYVNDTTTLTQLELLAMIESDWDSYAEQTLLTLEVPDLEDEELVDYIDSTLLDAIEDGCLGNHIFRKPELATV